MEFYTFITEHFDLPGLSIPDLGDMDPREAAQQLRAQWRLGVDPLPNCVHLAEAHGVRVLSLPEGTQDVDAFSVWEGGHPYVFLSARKTPERSRFDIAHEIGHLVLHAGLGHSSESERNAEKEAHQFASEFLMPRVLLRSLVGREPGIAAILKLKVHLGVSAMALAYALHKAELMSEWSYRQACVELTKRGYRTAEPEGMCRETSRVFRVVLPELRRSKGWGAEDLAMQLGVNPSELHGLTFGQVIVDVQSERVTAPSRDRSRSHLSLVQ